MRPIIILNFIIGSLLGRSLYAQSSALYCPDVVSPSLVSGYVYLPFDANLMAEGAPLPLGSHIIAAFEGLDGEMHCAGEREWQGYSTVMAVRGASGAVPGYQTGQPYQFWIELPNGCILDSVEATYHVNDTYPDGALFAPAGKSQIASMNAFSRYAVAAAAIAADTCGADTGNITLEITGGVAPLSFEWNIGAAGHQLENAAAGDYTVTATDNQGCITQSSFTIPSAPCPLLLCDATCNGSPLGAAGCRPFSVSFTDASTSEAGIISRDWDFGDGNSSAEPNPTHIYEQAGVYMATLTVHDRYQAASRSFEITVYDKPIAIPMIDYGLCQPNRVSLSAESPDEVADWSWAFDDGQQLSGREGLLEFAHFNTTVSGILQITDARGCANQLEVMVEIPEAYDLSVAGLATEEPRCGQAGGSISLSASGGLPPYTCHWAHDDMLAATTATGLLPGSYAFTITDANGCSQSGELSLEDHTEVPAPNLGEDRSFCEGAAEPLDAGIGGVSFQWFLDGQFIEGVAGPALTPVMSGTYQVQATNADGCTGIDAVVAIILPEITAEIAASASEACPGDTVALVGAEADRTEWIDTSKTLITVMDAEALAAPYYTTTYGLIAANACSADTAYYTLQVTPRLANAGPDTCIARGRTAGLQASGALSYRWDESRFGLSAYDIPNPLASPDSSAWYLVAMEDSLGCRYVDSVFVEVIGLEEIDIPLINVITPNGDGQNDRLAFPMLAKFTLYKLTIFNRWGETVYQSINYQNDWEGNYRGKPLPAGVYFYVLETGDRALKSSLTIIRE